MPSFCRPGFWTRETPMAKPPSTAQAKRLSWLCGRGKAFAHLPKKDPTEDVLVREGWVEKEGGDFTFPSGSVGAMYVISEAGIDALAAYFRKNRTGGASHE